MSLVEHFGEFMSLVEHFGEFMSLVEHIGSTSWHEDSSFDLAIGCRDNPQSMSEIFTSSACMPSWVMARRKSLFICMLPWVMATLCAQDCVFVRSGSPSPAMVWLGYLSSAMDWLGFLSWAWIGEGLSLKAWIGAGPSLLEAGQSLLGKGQSHHVSDVLSLDPGYISMHSLCGPGLGLFL